MGIRLEKAYFIFTAQGCGVRGARREGGNQRRGPETGGPGDRWTGGPEDRVVSAWYRQVGPRTAPPHLPAPYAAHQLTRSHAHALSHAVHVPPLER